MQLKACTPLAPHLENHKQPLFADPHDVGRGGREKGGHRLLNDLHAVHAPGSDAALECGWGLVGCICQLQATTTGRQDARPTQVQDTISLALEVGTAPACTCACLCGGLHMHATTLQECLLCSCSWHTCIMGRLIGWLACCCAVRLAQLSGKPPAVVKTEVVRHWGSFVGTAVGCEMEVTMLPVAACSRTGQGRDVAHCWPWANLQGRPFWTGREFG